MNSRNPHIYEIHSFAFLSYLSEKYQKRITIGSVPAEEWKGIADKGFHYVWLMGVWKRSPASKRIASTLEELQKRYDEALPGWSEDDVAGSAYSVFDYSLDSFLGGPKELAKLKSALNKLGLGLILDFVPNHMAVDHPWILAHPARFVRGTEEDHQKHPGLFFQSGQGVYIGHGKDPYWPGWTDTAQINYYAREAREAMVHALINVSAFADGVRCDMAHLALNDVFEKTWGPFMGQNKKPKKEFWVEVIQAVKDKNPDFVFLAEVYGDDDKALLSSGFDYTYDKTLYDLFVSGSAADIKHRVQNFPVKRTLKFIENHDEERSLNVFGFDKARACAVAVMTLPGAHLFLEGQSKGWKRHLPVQLKQRKEEAQDDAVNHFYAQLLALIKEPLFQEGKWHLLNVDQTSPDDRSSLNLLAWHWTKEEDEKIIVINFSGSPSYGRVRLFTEAKPEGDIDFLDEIKNERYHRKRGEIQEQGLFVSLGPWDYHLLKPLKLVHRNGA